MLEAEYANPTFPLRLLGKDLRLFEEGARRAGLAPAVAAAALRTVEAAEARGHGEDDYSALAEGIASLPASSPRG